MKKITTNRKAYYEYYILDTYTAGIQLKGSEVKSVRLSNVSITEAYCFIQDEEMFIKGMHIAEHKEGGKHYNHLPLRDRKLLLKKKEIQKLLQETSQQGLTIVPLEVYISNTGFIKVSIGLAKGKKTYDKRESIKAKDIKRDLERNQ